MPSPKANYPIKNQPKQKLRLRYGRIFITIIFLITIFTLGHYILQIPIKNIIIKGNTTIKDQTIIELAGIENYPSIIQTNTAKVKKKLEKEQYIKEATVTKKKTTIIITIQENRPLFYYAPKKETILLDKSTTKEILTAPIVINYIKDTIYSKFIPAMEKVKPEVLIRISEIKYDPNEVDEGRFLLTMSDGNYVYLTINKFENINAYIEIIKQKQFENKKGILYLDAGNSFEIIEN